MYHWLHLIHVLLTVTVHGFKSWNTTADLTSDLRYGRHIPPTGSPITGPRYQRILFYSCLIDIVVGLQMFVHRSVVGSGWMRAVLLWDKIWCADRLSRSTPGEGLLSLFYYGTFRYISYEWCTNMLIPNLLLKITFWLIADINIFIFFVVYFFLIRYNKQNIQTSRWRQLNLSYL